MPPKAKSSKSGDSSGAVVKESFQLQVQVTDNRGNDNQRDGSSFYLRIACAWLDCCASTDILGSAGFPLVVEEGSGMKRTTYSYDCEPNLPLNTDKFTSFNTIPGLFVFLMKKSADGEESLNSALPVSFAYVDCSVLAINPGQLFGQSESYDGIDIQVSIVSSKPLFPASFMQEHEPVQLTIHGLTNFPLNGKDMNAALNSLYVYHQLQLSDSCIRHVYGKPQLLRSSSRQAAIDSDSDDEKYNSSSESDTTNCLFDLQVCLFPSVSMPMDIFKEKLTSTTFSLELYDQPMSAIFSKSFQEGYINIAGDKPRKASIKADATASKAKDKDNKKGKEAPPDKSKAKKEQSTKTAAGPATAIDRYLIEAVMSGLAQHRDIYPHGSLRYRLDQLLSDTAELAIKFANMRKPSSSTHNMIDASEHSTRLLVEDDLALDLRYENPIKPQPWKLPDDLSLKKALEDKPTQTSSAASKTIKKSIFEQCVDCDTQMIVTAKLHKHVNPTAKSDHAHVDEALKKKIDRICSTILSSSTLPEGKKLSLAKALALTPYGRMVIVMDYDNDDFLSKVNEIIKAVNSKALPDIQGNITSYSLSKSEHDDLVNEKLDLISGFMIIDERKRILVLEGLAYPGHSMEYLYKSLSHDDIIHGPDDAHTKILYHPSILFPTRLYPQYAPDIKRIHLRYTLKNLVLKTELYSRHQIDEICFDGIDKLTSLLLAEDFYTCKKLDYFPRYESLEKMEILFGESISRVDITGYAVENQRQQRIRQSKQRNDAGNEISANTVNDERSFRRFDGNSSSSRRLMSRLPAVKSRNDAYLEHLHDRASKPPRNYLLEQQQLRQHAYEELLLKNQYKKAQQEEYLRSIGVAQVYAYSTQSLNYKRKAFDILRKKLFHNQQQAGLYTYSEEYVSQTFSYEDNESLQAKEFAYINNHKSSALDDRKQWITSKGFRYPVPKSYEESRAHPQQPSKIRIEELKEPWLNDLIPPAGVGFGSSIDAEASPTTKAKLIEKEKNFHTFHKSIDLFGGMEEPKFEHPFQLSLVGDRSGKLPRGKLLNPNQENKEFFNSIHIAGDEQQRIIQEAMKKEKADWKAKVVVDHEDFKVDGFLVKDHVTSQVDRYTDILHDDPKRIALKSIRNHKSSTKKLDWAYSTTPMTIINKNEEYIDNIAKVGLRVVEKEKFITAREDEEPKDFTRYIAANASAPRIVKLLSTRPMGGSKIEKSGPKWESVS